MMEDSKNIATPKPVLYTVIGCKHLNIRKKPNKESEILCVVPAGTFLDVKAISDTGWARVFVNSEIKGYAMKSFIKES